MSARSSQPGWSVPRADSVGVMQEKLTAAEISEALQGGLRCSSEVRGALLAGRGIRRGDLLGSRRNFEGLSRVSRCRNATVYELDLGC